MNGGDAGDAASAGAAGPHAQLAGAGDAQELVANALGVSGGENAAFPLELAAESGADDAGGSADAWESVALEGDARAKRFKMDTSGTSAASVGPVELPPPLSMALGGGASAFTITSGPSPDLGANSMSAVLQQHVRQQQVEQEQRQRALQMQAQQQRLAQPPAPTSASVGAAASEDLAAPSAQDENQNAALYGVQPLETPLQAPIQSGGVAVEPTEQQNVVAQEFPSGDELKFTIPVAHTGVVQHQSMASQWNQPPPPQQQQQQAQQQPPQQQPALANPVPVKEVPSPPVTAAGTSHQCLICEQEGGVFSCQGGCGLHAHPACIGEDVIVQFSGNLLHVRRNHSGSATNNTAWPGASCSWPAVWQLLHHAARSQLEGGSDEGRRGPIVCKASPNMLVPPPTRSNLWMPMTTTQMRRAILWLNLETNNPLSFEKFGHMTSLRLWEIGRVRQS